MKDFWTGATDASSFGDGGEQGEAASLPAHCKETSASRTQPVPDQTISFLDLEEIKVRMIAAWIFEKADELSALYEGKCMISLFNCLSF